LQLYGGLISSFKLAKYKQKLNLQAEKTKHLENQISEKRIELYQRIFSQFFDIIKEQKTKKETDLEQSGIRLIDIKKDALIYPPSHIVRQIIHWNDANSKNTFLGFQKYLELIRMIRTDLGHQGKLSDNELLRTFINDEEERNRFLKLINDNISQHHLASPLRK
jgi:hypothetical protein